MVETSLSEREMKWREIITKKKEKGRSSINLTMSLLSPSVAVVVFVVVVALVVAPLLI